MWVNLMNGIYVGTKRGSSVGRNMLRNTRAHLVASPIVSGAPSWHKVVLHGRQGEPGKIDEGGGSGARE